MDKQGILKFEITFIPDVVEIVRKGRDAAYSAVNVSMLDTYWNIGRRIVQEEQCGVQRAEYGAQLLKVLSTTALTKEFGKGFSERNLAYYRLFYLTFNDLSILHTRVQNLT